MASNAKEAGSRFAVTSCTRLKGCTVIFLPEWLWDGVRAYQGGTNGLITTLSTSVHETQTYNEFTVE